MALYLLNNPIQHYPWGSTTLLPDLLGIPNPGGKPYAEIWMGAHPRAPSAIESPAGRVPLNEFLSVDSEERLGPRVAAKFGAMPFLFKFLAAAEPLSIQAHPEKPAAERGFARENEHGPALDSPQRNYRDANHKPEILAALTPFDAMLGFRAGEEIARIAEELGVSEYLRLASRAPDDLRVFFSSLLTHAEPAALVHSLVEAAVGQEGEQYRWVGRLNRDYPGDIGVAAPLFMNLLHLVPGEAVFLPPGELHAYLGGMGLELMANSDNVLRGGLTAKHIDVSELLKVLRFHSLDPTPLLPKTAGTAGPQEADELVYSTPAEEFVLSSIHVSGSASFEGSTAGGCEILACTQGSLRIEGFSLRPGDSVLLTADHGRYRIEGDGVVYRAAVPG